LSYGGAKNHWLQHFCFSCRTMNMGVETWVYRRLGRPRLALKGDIVANPIKDDREIGWIIEDDGLATAATNGAHKSLRRIVLRGGCDMSAISHYLAVLADELQVELHLTRDDRQIRTDHSAFLRLALDDISPAAQASLIELGYAPEDWTSSLSLPSGEMAGRQVWLLSFWADSFSMLYRHKQLGVIVPFTLPHDPHAAVDITRLDDAYLKRFVTTPRQKSAVEALRREYVAIGVSDKRFLSGALRSLVARAPAGTLICVLLGPETWTDSADGGTKRLPDQVRVNRWIRGELGRERNVTLLDPLAIAGHNPSRTEALHFDRLFYQRVAQSIRSSALEFARASDFEKSPPRSAFSRPWRQHIAAILDRFTMAETRRRE
jgi:hypothetical protein